MPGPPSARSTVIGIPEAATPRRGLDTSGLAALGQVKSARLLALRSSPGPTARARSWARAALRRFVPAGQEESLVRAMVLGDRAGLDDHTAEAFRVSGTYHVLALSGAQVALVVGMIVAAARRGEASPTLQAVLGGGAAMLYATFVGGDIPVVRASLMAIVLLVGRALDLDADLANLLGLAALALLVHRPSNVADVGFQLSFGATLGLLLLTPPLVAGLPRLPLGLERALGASVAAQLALLPLLATHFHRLAPLGLVLNLVAVPLASGVLLAGFAVLVSAALLPVLAVPAGNLAWLAAHALLRSSELGLVSPSLDPRMPAPSWLAWGVQLSGLALLARGRRAAGLGVCLLAVVLIVIGPPRREVDGRLHMTVLDVGQGDAIVVRSPRGRVLVVDAGAALEGRFDLGETVVAPYLWSLGLTRIDILVLTHAHPDHVGGAPFLTRAFEVGETWEGPAPVGDRRYARLDAALQPGGCRPPIGVAGRLRGLGRGARSRRRAAPARPPAAAVRNDDSVVLALEYGSVRMLLTGRHRRPRRGSPRVRRGGGAQGPASRKPLEQPRAVRVQGRAASGDRLRGTPQPLRPSSPRGARALPPPGRAPGTHGSRRGGDHFHGRRSGVGRRVRKRFLGKTPLRRPGRRLC